ncbi:MAG TPA: phosphatase PAP2 family protein [Acidimicrobiia bacterium]|jgi:membrane-associated phospholipid phosphatase|nr:phosphatase PAP2 family protein [Acidimicrobiia bacterium]
MVWHKTGPLSWEWRIMAWTRRNPPPAASTWQRMFEPAPFALIAIAIAGVALVERRPKLAFSGAVGCGAAVVAAENLFKPLIERRQPYHWSPWFPDQHLGFITFPSGHVAGAAACATFAWFVLSRRTRLAALAFALPIIVGWAMVSLRHHYPADVVAGFLLGPLVVCATVLGAQQVFGRDEVATGARPSAPDRLGSS